MFNLTQQERQVILFLVAVALLGAGVNFLMKRYLPARTFAAFSQDIGKINLNAADKNLLMEVPGIGEKLASRIIDYRQKEASFSSIEELKKIQGISDYRYEKIKDEFILR